LGFVGAKLVAKLIDLGKNPLILVRENQKDSAMSKFGGNVGVCTIDELSKIRDQNHIRTIVNLAGKYHFSPNHMELAEMVHANIVLPRLIAEELSQDLRKIKWIQASTFMQHVDSRPFFPSCFYAATKFAAECDLQTFAQSGIDLTTLVLPHIYGEGDGRQKLLNYLIQQMENRQEIHVSSGTQVMDLVHVDDIVNAIILSMSSVLSGGRYQVSSWNPLTIRDLIQYVFRAANSQVPVKFDTSKDRLFEPREIWSCAEALAGWNAKILVSEWINLYFQKRF
jgi:nucleoside-diphosphate-sugar epimerase